MDGPEVLRREMMSAGDRLVEALALEVKAASLMAKDPRSEVVRHWRKSRKNVEKLTQDYLRKVDRYRQSVQATFLKRTG
jgi:hypothetical protein